MKVKLSHALAAVFAALAFSALASVATIKAGQAIDDANTHQMRRVHVTTPAAGQVTR